jgi:hypothetical protein
MFIKSPTGVNVIKPFLCRMSVGQCVANKPNLQSIVMLTVVMLYIVMLSVANMPNMHSVVMQYVIMLGVVAARFEPSNSVPVWPQVCGLT